MVEEKKNAKQEKKNVKKQENLAEGLQLNKKVEVAGGKRKGIPFSDKEKEISLTATAEAIRKHGGIPTSPAPLVNAVKDAILSTPDATPEGCSVKNTKGEVTKEGERPYASYLYLANKAVKKLKAMAGVKEEKRA